MTTRLSQLRPALLIVATLLMIAALLLWLLVPTVPDFSQYRAGVERKQAFFDYFVPIVQQENKKILVLRDTIIDLRTKTADLSWFEARKLRKLAATFGLENFDIQAERNWDELLLRASTIPPSLALAQAANESGWGTSRFAVEGHNYFGQWCFTPGCGIVPSKRSKGQLHEVAAFNSPRASVEQYLRNLNRHQAYGELRRIRATLSSNNKPLTGHALAAGLGSYSERGTSYIEELRQMIRFNKLGRFDQLPVEQPQTK